jgi:Spy/CpxP family protein refolding chaperone
MKKAVLMLGLIVVIGLGNASYSEDGPPPHKREKGTNVTPEERAAKRTERMKTELSLSEQQTKEVGALNLKHAQEMEALRAEAKQKRTAHKAAIKAVLTDEQRKLLEQKEQENKETKQGEEELED